MVTSFHALISRILNIPVGQVERTIGLLGEGATIPFISRYRKEVTGGLMKFRSAISKISWTS